jgi:hypothetical protein
MCQVRNEKASVSEPLMKCRKHITGIKSGDSALPREQYRGRLLTACAVPGMKVARAHFRLMYGTWEPVVSMLRETLKWRPHKSQSTNVRHRGGLARSSVEAAVMEVERRGWVIWQETLANR